MNVPCAECRIYTDKPHLYNFTAEGDPVYLCDECCGRPDCRTEVRRAARRY